MICSNRGCGRSFTENGPEDCIYHPGAPVFHEGLKGWSCCPKKVIDFDEFMKIPGCAKGMHQIKTQDIKPAEKEKRVLAPVQVDRNGVETYGTEKKQMPTADPVPKPAEKPPKIKEEDLKDDPNADIPVNTKCKRPSCKAIYSNDSSRQEECIFHSGEPVFHEGSKGWSCCTRKVLEFDEFLKIAGCKKGIHRFTDPNPTTFVECRKDWYQTPNSVIVSVFAKKADKSKTKVSFNTTLLKVHVVFEDGKEHIWSPNLNQPIIPEKSTFVILGTKLELNLVKANGISWPALEPTDQVKSWTTFGTTGFVGSVGSKQAIIATDAPLEMLK